MPSIFYQNINYNAVENNDLTDKDALVSQNTDPSSFLIRHQGLDASDDDEDIFEYEMNAESDKLKKKLKKKKKPKDMNINRVEDLKDSL